MKKRNHGYIWPGERDIVFQRAVTPIEAAALPAIEARPMGALHHARQVWRLGGHAQGKEPARLAVWKNQRQNI